MIRSLRGPTLCTVVALCASACGASSPAPEPARTTTERAPPERSALARWQDETLGPLRLGMSEAEIVSALGEPASRPAFEEMEATGERVAVWAWPALGVTAMMIEGESGAGVSSWSLEPPATFVSGHGGIGIGASYDEVLAAYADVPSGPDADDRTDDTRERIVLGNAYENLSFRFADGRLFRVHLGATGAE